VDWRASPSQEVGNNFDELVKSCQQYKTASTPNFGIVQPKVDDPRIYEKDQSMYRYVFGFLL
jgi:hypothetical protein